MMNLISEIPLVQQIISSCKKLNVRHIIMSPGSRNAPLILSFSHDDYFHCYSIVDERCAAFFAMGIAQQTGHPTALVCTSGSALLNYYPSIAEAFYSDIPLVILSADRPKELLDVGDGQTIRQQNVFANHIKYAVNLKNAPTYSEDIAKYNKVAIEDTLLKAIQYKEPVHINIPLYEPLYNTTSITAEFPERFNYSAESETDNSYKIDTKVIQNWSGASRKMVLVGVLSPNAIESEILDSLLEDPTVLVFTENTSNLHHDKIIPNIDQVIAELSEAEKLALQPDVLLTLGGLIVSKKIKQFLRKYSPKQHYHISEKTAYDTFGCLTKHIKINTNIGLKSFAELPNLGSASDNSECKLHLQSDYQKKWLGFHTALQKGHEAYMKEIPFCDLLVFHHIVQKCAQPLHLQLSNSSTIRYAQLFKLPSNIEVFCNRGTSGIDGSTSTAIGASIIQSNPTLLITGDLSFFYDSNALWNNYIPHDFKIIVINNNGGGIFRILPGDKNDSNFEKYLETTHQLKANHLAAMFGFSYLDAEVSNFEEKLDLFFELKTKAILEITTPRRLNDVVLLNYFKKIREKTG